jgi:hypothetical protein
MIPNGYKLIRAKHIKAGDTIRIEDDIMIVTHVIFDYEDYAVTFKVTTPDSMPLDDVWTDESFPMFVKI